MAETIVELLTDVADAIREKKGSNEPINAQNFANEIKNLPSGGDNGLADALVKRTITEYVNNEITEIGDYVFYHCKDLTSLSLSNVTKIGKLATFECISLTTLEVPNVEELSIQAIYGCKVLKEVYMPRLTYLNDQAFRACSALTRADIGNCTSIGAMSFFMTKLDTLIIHTPSVCTLANTNVFDSTPIKSGTGFVYVPDNLVDAYKEATNWSTFANQIKPISELPNNE
jgi:hypothetical protein